MTGEEVSPVSDDEIPRKVGLLRSSRYFLELAEDQLPAVAAVADLISIPEGEQVISKGARADAMFVLEAGSVEVFDEDQATGAERLLRRLGPGACFGEMGFLTGRQRTATVRTRDACTLLRIRSADFEALVRGAPEVAIATCKSLAEWLYNTSSRDVQRWVKLSDFPYQTEAVLSLPQETLETLRVLPLHRDGRRVVVAMVDPTDLLKVDALRSAMPGAAVETVAVAERELVHFLDKVLPKLRARAQG